MKYIKCPKCELNYINADEEELCLTCRGEELSKAVRRSSVAKSPKMIKAPVRYKGRAIFFVFQSKKEFECEHHESVIKAPYYDDGKHQPHHWARLINVQKGDVIVHGVEKLVLAISEAKGSYYDFFYDDNMEGRKIDCEYHLLRVPLIIAEYKDEIIKFCPNYKYQPFNKNGKGNEGYLFDICEEIAKLFISDIVAQNSDIAKLSLVNDILL